MSDQTIASETPAEGLRAWAKGMYPLEAATELLIRAGRAQSWRPWVFKCEDGGADRDHWYGIDFAAIPDHIGGMSSGERRLMLLAASIGSSEVEVSLNDMLCGNDRDKTELLLAAIAHAAGTHEGRAFNFDFETRTASVGEPYTSLHPWPAP